MSDVSRKLNLHFTDQFSYLEGLHRSGWPYVMINLLSLHADNGILCDSYVDRSFLWNKNANVPYTVPWVGFIHHTFDTTFSMYNNVELLRRENFLSSLPHCRGLFVFSQVAKTKWSHHLTKIGHPSIPVVALVHPTQFVTTLFSMEKFKSNSQRTVIQIGAWLRDNYAVFRLNDGKPEFLLEDGTVVYKAALVGPKMEHYYRPFDFFRRFRPPEWKRKSVTPSLLVPMLSHHSTEGEAPSETISSVNGELPDDIFDEDATGDNMCRDDVCRDLMCRDSDFGLNKYVVGAIDLLSRMDASVITFPTMSNEEYDDFLSQNIVFLKLIDAAAVNTLLECIVRNTPIVINPLPAVVEILGELYPLYYQTLEEVPSLISLENISAAYHYLDHMDKTALRIETFMDDIVNSSIYQDIVLE
jgi:hypothetical protein